MNPQRAEILNRIIIAQKSVGGRLQFDTTNTPYLYRKVGKKELFIHWDNEAETYKMLSLVPGAEGLEHYDMVGPLKQAVEYHLANELKEANAIGSR